MTITTYQLFINGCWRPARTGKTFASLDPSTGEPWAFVADAGVEDVDAAVEAADTAFRSGAWQKMNGAQRADCLRRLAAAIVKHAPTLSQTETTDTGKLLRETRWQSANVAKTYEYYAGLADKIEGTIPPFDGQQHLSMVLREPIGVVAAIVPWNSQLHLAAYKIAPALAAGNTVVVKASEHASCAMMEFAKVVEEADLPPGVLNIITGGAECGSALVSHPMIGKVSFTGGLETARHVIRSTANNLARLHLELGGKSPLIICDDADLDSALNGAISAIFAATGQSCVAGSRLLLQDGIYDAFLERLVRRTSEIRIGHPLDENTDIGPLATARQRETIERLLSDSIAKGARIRIGGKRPAGFTNGFYFEPTIAECDHQDYPIVRNELFGPVLSVLRFKTDEDAIKLANDSRYAFAGGVFTTSLNRAMTFARAVRAGRLWVNTYRVASVQVPFGGTKDSGYGREAGIEAIYDYTETKSVIIDISGKPIADPFIMRG